jgi:ABC-type branched-subunit amino acid transport system substrate-binding protein
MRNRLWHAIQKSLRAAAVIVLVATGGAAGSGVRAADNVKIGFSMPLTGPLASNGKAILTAYQMWQEDVNAKGGLLGRKVELVHYDDQSNPTLVPAIYAKLLDIDKVDLVVSSYGTNMTMPAMPVEQGAGALAVAGDPFFLGWRLDELWDQYHRRPSLVSISASGRFRWYHSSG